MSKEIVVKGNLLATIVNMIHLYKFNNRCIEPDTIMIPYNWLYDRLLIEDAKQPSTVLDGTKNKVYGLQIMWIARGYRTEDGNDINTITVLSMFKNIYEEKLHLVLNKDDWT